MPILHANSQAFVAYNEIKRRILGGDFAPGARLREVEVAELLTLGRTPVREALKRIQDEGLLRQEPGRGLVVAEMDQQEVGELYAMRESLESTAASLAAHHATEAEILNMEAILMEGGDDPVAQNLRFHEAIYSAAHNRYLMRLLRTLTDTTYLLGRSTLASPVRAEAALREHSAIVAAIRRRDPEGAAKAARHHIHQALMERLKMLRQG
ncbi:GntR family transcriptional regulator [Bordetella ansorpii]|uniref:GntR family transcriptional regulator n=1 Tax=Bordetella ansorpii TaxID=288768 RepID=A0A157STD1_9BORD|nr:GntR family transcriptional regulator [Bordetella ansorpii]SAI73738.1 GntR family transcriptional regulator [Bordetella ansorpii]